MKIAFVYDVVYPYVKGGVEKRNFELASELSKKHEVHMYGMNYWDGEPIRRENGYVLHGVCKKQEIYSHQGKRKILPSIYFSLKLIPELFKEKYDIVDCSEFPYFPIFVCKLYSILKGTKVVYSWHEVWGKYWFDYLGPIGVFGFLIEKAALLCSDKIISVSPKTTQDLIDSGVNPKKITIISNGIDFEELEKANQKENGAEIVFAGRLVSHKNAELLVNAMKHVVKEVPTANCLIIGRGPEESTLRSLVLKEDLSKNVQIIEPVEKRKDYFGILKSAKVFVSPSEREGFGITIIEAQAAGLPVITLQHDNNAGIYLVDHGVDGLICTKDPNDLSEKIVDLLKNDKKRKSFAKVSKLKVQDRSWKNIATQLEENFEKIMATA